ncbi:extracellular solute-binding protein [Aquibacillus salsiterrae]|uniref:Extracellular solute-binding protein n=1 Tax=Aquibacillus salsiterrae TaxID=2950439 RepID=A0A9X3WBX0_9BACI|nr:extracellular solute-binding protein [Aquibacillus salsiterrae]MDC3416870.1 extracellular solute-binding protein [Aquibacillus salsiterrae]
MFSLNNKKIIVSFIVFILILTQIQSSSVIAGENEKEGAVTNSKLLTNDISFIDERYSSYLTANQDQAIYQGEKLTFDSMETILVEQEFLKSVDGSMVAALKQNDEVTLVIDAPKNALYQIALNFKTENDYVLPVRMDLKVNDDRLFYELRNLVFESEWMSPEEIRKDKYGNEIVPQPVKGHNWQKKFIMDSSYRTNDPFLIELEKGENELTFNVLEGEILVKSLELSSPTKLESNEQKSVTGSNFISVQGEDIALRNDSSIRAGSLYNVDLTPYSAENRVLNYLADDSFKKPGHEVQYEFEVREDGYYYLGLNYQQGSKADFPVFMQIKLDGKIPFKKFKDYPFEYTRGFENTTLINKETNEKIPVYLKRGTHKVSFMISIAPLKPTIEKVEQLSSEIQALSLELTNLAGPNLDRNRDIDIEEFLPGVENQLINWADEINQLYQGLKAFSPNVTEIGAFSQLNIAEEQLKSLAEEVDKLIVRKNELSTGTNSITAYLGTLLQQINDNGFAIDQIYFYQDEKDIPKGKGFLYKQYSKLERLVKSFGNQDYSVDSTDPNHLQVWINRPRQYVEIIQQLIDEEFTPETGIEVDLSLMPDQNKLILANAAGDAPDVAVGVNYALPFEIAIRGALQNLEEYKDFGEVKNRFPQGLLIPGTVEGGTYSIPDTMNFWVLFYRKDILEKLQLPVPDTLDQVRTYLPELQRKGMNFFYPTAGMPGLKIFAGTMPVIYQNGGKFYGETIGQTQLNDNETIEGMRQLTELFTIYNAPYDVPSFYQQFRDGSLPIGISDYFMYNLILNAAPEIANLWDIALMPGVENENGEIQRWSAGGAESNIIFKESDKKEDAWEFLKWWSDKEVQVAFGNILQTTYGKEYIWNTANIEAFDELPWVTNHKNVILEQTEWVTEVPRVPGSYMLERELSNAYNSIVLDGENLRNAVDLASKRVKRETLRKLEEFGYYKDGNMIKPYLNPASNNE